MGPANCIKRYRSLRVYVAHPCVQTLAFFQQFSVNYLLQLTSFGASTSSRQMWLLGLQKKITSYTRICSFSTNFVLPMPRVVMASTPRFASNNIWVHSSYSILSFFFCFFFVNGFPFLQFSIYSHIYHKQSTFDEHGGKKLPIYLCGAHSAAVCIDINEKLRDLGS